MTIFDELSAVIDELKLQNFVRPMLPAQARDAVRAAQERFAAKPDARWWWDALMPSLSVVSTPSLEDAFRYLPMVCPDVDAWLFASDDNLPPWPVFVGRPSDLSVVIAECRYFEYAVASPALDWVIFENHHNSLIAAGDPVVPRLRQMLDNVELM